MFYLIDDFIYLLRVIVLSSKVPFCASILCKGSDYLRLCKKFTHPIKLTYVKNIDSCKCPNENVYIFVEQNKKAGHLQWQSTTNWADGANGKPPNI